MTEVVIKFVEVIIAFFATLVFTYIVTRLIAIAWHRTKQEFENKRKGAK